MKAILGLVTKSVAIVPLLGLFGTVLGMISTLLIALQSCGIKEQNIG